MEDKRGHDAQMKAEVARMYATTSTVADVRRDDRVAMTRLGSLDVYRSYGCHAGGILLSGSTQKIDDYVPRMLVASSNLEVSQFDMDDVEQLGFLKLDVLGQTILSVMRRCQELMDTGHDPTDFTWIPKNDSAACKILREGRTDNGIFHFEGYTKAKGGKRMGIKSTMDAVLAQGLFMPGAMDSGQMELYLSRRKMTALERKKRVVYIHPVFAAALKDTYGAVVFQEQVIQIMRGFGMSQESINTLFKIVKDSGAGAEARNAKRLGQIREEFGTLTSKAGLTGKQIEDAWQSTAGFAAYGFNRAHATGYGIRAYRCAYLKAHYPLEYMTALLEAWAGKDKETLYIRECREMGIRILPPTINAGSTTWVMDKKRNAVRKGLTSIKGVGQAAAEDLATNAPFTSVTDIIERTSITGGKSWAKDRTLNGVLKILHDNHLLDDIIDNDKEVTA
jgi:DNA polymerase-3 subunit alpha